MAAGRVRVRVLGPASVEGGGPLAPRDRQVLAALVVEARRVCPADRLAEALYGASPPATWRKVVHGSISRLRQQLGSHAIVTTGTGYRLELGDDEIDAHLFDRLLAEAERFSAIGEHERAALRLAAAVELLVGEPWADLDGWGPALGTAARYRELACQAEEQLVREELASGQYRVALAKASELVVREPLREQRWAALALAQYQAGRQGEALRTIGQARRVLAEELGLEPGPELVGLQGAILAQDPALAGPPAAAGWHAGACPYRGLAAYGVDDAEWFFGRDREIAECLRIVDANGLVAIVGASGSGKSSLAQAGLAPALRRDGREVAVVVPGADPDQVLAGLARGSALVVDQLEELFVTSADDLAKARFAAAVVRRSAVAPVVVTVRADHLAQVAELPDLAARVQAGVFLLGAMGETELRSAIEGPAAKAGLRLEPGLADLMVRDVAGQPGALPLLSHALTETYERREGQVLTADGYRAIGGVKGAVARAADSVIDSLPPAGRRAARDLFLRLVAVSETSDPVRQRVPRAALAGDPTSVAVLDALVGSRLVIADETTVEIAHEAVCQAWPRLRAWLDEDRDGHRLHRHLTLAAQEWDQSGRDPSELYRGSRLEAAVNWDGRDAPTLNQVERAFLSASTARRDAEQNEDHRRLRRLRATLVAVAGLLVVAVVAGLLAVRSDQAARHQRDRAEAAQLDARLDALVSRSLSLRSANRGLAALLAVEAYRRRPDAAARSALLATFTGSPGFVGYQYLPARHQVTGALVPGSTSAVVALDGRDLRLLDLPSGHLDARFPPAPPGTLNDSVVRVSSDGRYVAQLAAIRSATTRITLSVYEVWTGHRVLGPLPLPFPAGDVALNGDGSLVAVAGGPGGDLAVYRRMGAHLVGTVPGLGRPAGVNVTRTTAAVVFDAAGRLYLGSISGTIRVVDPATMRVLDSYGAPLLSSNNQLVVTPGRLLIAAGDEAALAINTSTGTTSWITRRQPGSNACTAIAAAAAAGRLYCLSVFTTGASANLGRVGRLEERDLATGLPTGTVLDPQQGTVGDIAVTADEHQLITFSHNAPVLSEWRLDGTGPVTTRVGQGWIGGDYDPTGTMLLVRRASRSTLFQDELTSPKTLSVWNPVADRIIDPLNNISQAAWAGPPGRLGAQFADGTSGLYDLTTHTRVSGVALAILDRVVLSHNSSDGTRLYVADVTGRLRTIDSRTGQVIRTLQLDGPPTSIATTADGSRIITTTIHNGAWSMSIRDATTGRKLGKVPDINTAQIGPGDTLVAGTIVGDITQYDIRTLKPLGTFPGVRGLVAGLSFSHDGKILIAISQDRTVSIYDTRSRTRLGDPIPWSVRASLRPDGAAVAVGTGDGVAIWDLNPQHLAADACRLAGRNLTPAEWDTYLGALGPYRPTCPEHT